MGVGFEGSSIIQDKTSFNHVKVVNLYIVCESNLWSHDLGTDFTFINLRLFV